ncbi:hypothetical protein M0R45_030458 [Rubus argutus]|uniref:HTH three-helical bundle domain-containing protein n=1 Tax=Rubus argutus TaxID=59490 RepID=A0AAW1WDK4_RUBAR
MAPFPCRNERTAASALLLLTATPPKFCLDGDDESSVRSERGKGKNTECRDQSFVSGDSNSSCTSVLASSYVSKEEIQARKIRMIALAALHRDVKLKSVQKSRAKIQGGVKFNSWKTNLWREGGHDDVVRIHVLRVFVPVHKFQRGFELKKQQQLGSAKLRRKAEAILNLLSQGCYSEVKIRQTLGDSPDTSKALRLLLKFEEVKRSGAGGRRCPYIYTV